MTNYARTTDEISELLEKWKGSRAQAWEYSVSHGQLLIRIYSDKIPGLSSLFLWCKGCDRVNFKSYWTDSNFQISTSHGEHDLVWLVQDRDFLNVTCIAVFAFECDDWHDISIRDLSGLA